MENLLKNKIAVVYGAGSIGGAVANAFAKSGAMVFVADHNEKASERFTSQNIQTEQVDVLDKDAVAAFVDTVIEKTGRIDISFTATSTHRPGGDQGAAINEVSWEDFSMPIIDYTKAHFNTANAVYSQMIKQHAGVIMGITAHPSKVPFPYTTGFSPAWAAIEAMLRTLAAELGPHGIRTVCLQSAGSKGAPDKTFVHDNPKFDERAKGWDQRNDNRKLLDKIPSLEEVGSMAAFMASDLAGATTGTTVSLDVGLVND